MESKISKLKEILARDKRQCERLTLPLSIYYSLRSAAHNDIHWSGPFLLDNICGEGLGFHAPEQIARSEQLMIKLMLPDDPNPVFFDAEIAWSRPAERGATGWAYGLIIRQRDPATEKKFMSFISDQILAKYLDETGQLRDPNDQP